MKPALAALLLSVACGGGGAPPPAVADDAEESPGDALIAAAHRGDADAVRRLLRQGAGDADGGTGTGTVGAAVLNIAAVRGDLAMVEACLVAGVPADVGPAPDLPIDKGPLDNAASYGHVEVVDALLRAGADAAAPRPALAFAASAGHSAVVRRLLAAGADPDLVLEGTLPLLAAVEGGHGPAVQALLEGCASVEIEVSRAQKDGTTEVRTARQHAAASGNRALLALLDAPRPPGCAAASGEGPPARTADPGRSDRGG